MASVAERIAPDRRDTPSVGLLDDLFGRVAIRVRAMRDIAIASSPEDGQQASGRIQMITFCDRGIFRGPNVSWRGSPRRARPEPGKSSPSKFFTRDDDDGLGKTVFRTTMPKKLRSSRPKEAAKATTAAGLHR